MVERASAEWMSDRQASWYGRVGRAHPDLRAAMEYSLTAPGEAEWALRMAVSLPAMYWRGRGLFGEGRRWLERGLAQVPGPTALRARALVLASELAFIQGDTESGADLLEEGTELAERLNHPASLATAAHTRGLRAMYANDLTSAVETLEQGRATITSPSDAEPVLLEKLLSTLGRAAVLAGDHERAAACARDVLALTEPVGETYWRSHALRILANVAWRRGELDEAGEYARICLHLSQETEDRFSSALEEMAWNNADQRRHVRAAMLLGCADRRFAELAAPITSYQHMLGFHRSCEQGTRAALGDAAYDAAFGRGRSLSYREALAFALEQPSAPRPAPTTVTPLTRRERQLAELINEGLSNKEMAARLVISRRTADTHVENILTELGFSSRAQVAAQVAAGRGA